MAEQKPITPAGGDAGINGVIETIEEQIVYINSLAQKEIDTNPQYETGFMNFMLGEVSGMKKILNIIKERKNAAHCSPAHCSRCYGKDPEYVHPMDGDPYTDIYEVCPECGEEWGEA